MTQPTAVRSDSQSATTLDLQPVPNQAEERLTLHAFGKTDRGRVRSGNEDQFLIATLAKSLQIQQTSLPQEEFQYGDERGQLLVVADGMGGHHGGEEASALAVDSIKYFILNTFKWFFQLQGSEEHQLLTEFENAVQQTDARLFEEARRHPKLWGMGTTLTLAYSLQSNLFLIHVGDSRCYLFRQGRLHQLTKDHTYVKEMVERGHLSAEEASHHHMRHVITNVVGGTEPGVRVEIRKLQVQPGDVVVLCSDGLTEMVADQDIAAILQATTEPQAACAQLIQTANQRGGQDNITVIVGRYEGDQ